MGSWHLSFVCPVHQGWKRSCWLSRPTQGRRLRAFPRWAAGLGYTTPAFCCSYPASCQILERPGRACFHVNSALVSRGLSKINLEISLPLALAEYRLPFPLLLQALFLSLLSTVSGVSPTVASQPNPRFGSSVSNKLLHPTSPGVKLWGLLLQFPPPLFHCLSLFPKGRWVNRTCLEKMKPALQPCPPYLLACRPERAFSSLSVSVWTPWKNEHHKGSKNHLLNES